MIPRVCSAAIVLLLLTPSFTIAQRTTVLQPKKLPGVTYAATSAVVRQNAATASADSLIAVYGVANITPEEQQQFGVLLADPTLRSGVRASSWTATLTSALSGTEVKLQLNICDFVGKACDNSKSAAYATLIGPAAKNEQYADLATLDGMLGTTRIETGWTFNATDTRWQRPAFTVKASFARPEFIYRENAASTPDTVEHQTHSLGADISVKSKSTLLAIGARFSDSFKPKPSVTICPPASSAPTVCSNAIVGAPASATTSVATLEGRYTFGLTTAIALQVQRDMKADVTVVDVPLWFIAPDDIKSPFFGGLRLNYRSDTKRSTVSIFISARKI